MPKHKYRFNPDSLSYDKIQVSFKKKVIRFLPHLATNIVAGAIAIIIFTLVIDSPKEKRLKRENRELLLQYEIMNKKLQQVSEVLEDIKFRDDNIYRVIFEAEPISTTIRSAGMGGVNRYEDLEGFDNSKIVINTAKKLDKIIKQLYVQSKSYDEVIKLAKNKEKMLACIPAIQPVLYKDLKSVSSYFGIRFDPVYKNTRKMHEGIDFTAPIGTEVFATGDGIIVEANYVNGGYGNEIIIRHGYGYSTRYAHLSKILVRVGQNIKRGEIIGKIGNTGKSVGPHLHYEILKNNIAVNPINFFYKDLSPAEYDKMIELSSQEGGQALD